MDPHSSPYRIPKGSPHNFPHSLLSTRESLKYSIGTMAAAGFTWSGTSGGRGSTCAGSPRCGCEAKALDFNESCDCIPCRP